MPLRATGFALFGCFRCWQNRHESPAAFFLGKCDIAFDNGKNRMVFANADIITGVPFGTTLANDNIARNNVLTAKFLDTKLGVKKFGGEHVIPGNIIIRQRGTKWHPGDNVGIGKDHTIFAVIEGNVTFSEKKGGRTFVSVLPTAEAAE